MQEVRTREDCVDWLSLEEIETEVFGAFVGARQHVRTFDFAAEAIESYPTDPLLPGTLVNADGLPWFGRSRYLEYLVTGIVWRLEALARRKGVDMADWDICESISGPSDCSTVAEKLAHPYWKPLGGEVRTLTKADLDALPAAQRAAILNSADTGRSISMPSGSPEA